jgi:hypothetical protein
MTPPTPPEGEWPAPTNRPAGDWRASDPAAGLNHKQLKALAKASRPWYAKKRTWIGGAFASLVLAGIISAAAGGSSKGSTSTKANGGVSTLSNNDDHPPQADAELTGCAPAQFLNYPQATVKVTNHSTKRSDYMVEVKFIDPSNTVVGTGAAIMSNVDPGQSALDTAGAVNVNNAAHFTCQISSVERFASH